ncbi:MAG: hypothetical protein LBU23_14000 [Planctomycetota bacterium]|jgi:hypothetical protein|nr:hypothetical protein [Planctomycetota bacterium]
MPERTLAVIAALLLVAASPAGEEYMPLNPGWQRATSLDAGSAPPAPQKNVVRLKIPGVKPAGESRARLVETAAYDDGRLDFSQARLETPELAGLADAAIPGLVTPEQLAVDHYRAQGRTPETPDDSNLWITPFPDIVGHDFPDWGNPARPGLPIPELPGSAAAPANPAGYAAPPSADLAGTAPALPEQQPAEAQSLRPPGAPSGTSSSLRPPGIPERPTGTGRPGSGDWPARLRDGFSGIESAARDGVPPPDLEVGFRPDESQADYFRQAENLKPAQFPDYIEPIRWPEPLPAGTAGFPPAPPPPTPAIPTWSDQTGARAVQPARIRSRRAKAIGITPIRELRDALQPIRRAAAR